MPVIDPVHQLLVIEVVRIGYYNYHYSGKLGMRVIQYLFGKINGHHCLA